MLPFTVDEFFAVFAAYNVAIWPAQVAAYGLGALAVWAILTRRSWAGRLVGATLGLLWLWNGIAYHLLFFAPINTAAYGFAALFVAQGVLFLAYGVFRDRIPFVDIWWNVRAALAFALIVYSALVYELLGYAAGHRWPNAPMFGVAPCPTTIFTLGVQKLAARPLPLWLIAIPLVWAGIGSIAAILLAVPQDLGLLVSGVLAAFLLSSWPLRRQGVPPLPDRVG